jgi:hypothetical protein
MSFPVHRDEFSGPPGRLRAAFRWFSIGCDGLMIVSRADNGFLGCTPLSSLHFDGRIRVVVLRVLSVDP